MVDPDRDASCLSNGVALPSTRSGVTEHFKLSPPPLKIFEVELSMSRNTDLFRVAALKHFSSDRILVK